MEDWLSITECAKHHGVSRATIHAAIDRGALAAKLVGKTWMIKKEDCEAYQPMRDARARAKHAAAVRWDKRKEVHMDEAESAETQRKDGQ